MRRIAFLAAVTLLAAAASAAEALPVKVMIVGDFHMSNPGRDLHNVTVDDMLSPERQNQIVAVTDALAAFKPTVVAAEWPADVATTRYADYRAGKLAPSHNEVVQLGFRLADKMGLTSFAGIDVDGDFPYEAVQTYAKAHGQTGWLDRQNLEIEAFVRNQSSRLQRTTEGATLRWLNAPALVAHGNDFYRTMLRIGGGVEQPGAALLTAWYRRNFLICANLVQLAKPGDRIVVFYGSGHAFLLRQCVTETPGFELIEPNDYLTREKFPSSAGRMKRILAVLVLLSSPATAASYGAAPPDLSAKLDKLVKSYPDFIAGHDATFLTLKDGRKFAISDGRIDKTFDQMVEHADVDDMFYADYPAGVDASVPARDFDPGRVRFEPLFNAMYGDCDRGEVAPKMRSIAWLPKHHGGSVSITSANGVDKALEAVSTELDALPEKYMKYLVPNSGTYNCRKIAGSTSRSVHAWGAAIDINSSASDYWRWSKDGWHNRIPVEIARVFERHGFIWGGRWWHYDTMHFEYRPELLP